MPVERDARYVPLVMNAARSLRPFTALVALVLAASACAASAAAVASSSPITQGARYSARGVIRGFGPNREHVNIAHEEIPGYMRAMTMSFEFENRAQSEGLSVGDSVVFTFEELPEGRFVLRAIARR
jgi:Cu/Ag efflux protein CusF